MSGKRKLESQIPSLSWGENPTDVTMEPTGTWFGSWPSPEKYRKSHQIYEYNITAPLELSLLTIVHQLLWSDKFLYSQGELALESLAVRGMKQVYLLTLKIPEPSSGMVIEINQMLSSMNFEAVSTSPMYYGGSIGTLCLWRSRDLPPHW